MSDEQHISIHLPRFGFSSSLIARWYARLKRAAPLAWIVVAYGCSDAPKPKPTSNEYKIGLKTIPAGTFQMGCLHDQGTCRRDEKPAHTVRITESFRMMESEVTQGLYKTVLGRNPSHFQKCGFDCPVDNISWMNTIQFANVLGEKMGLEPCYQLSKNQTVSWNQNCLGWRLPTEAEWEYAARGGQSHRYAGSDELHRVAWYGYNDPNDSERTIKTQTTKPVCQKERNGFGLCDMTGNVWEWVFDNKRKYTATSQTNPVHFDPTSHPRILRGGSWLGKALDAQISRREAHPPTYSSVNLGFRLVRSVEAD